MAENLPYSKRQCHNSLRKLIQRSIVLIIIVINILHASIPRVYGKTYEYIVDYETVDQIAISSDGLYTAAVVDRNSVYLFSSTLDLLWTKSFSSHVDSISISGDTHEILIAAYYFNPSSASSGGQLLLFDSSGELKWRKTYSNIYEAAISGNGEYVVAIVSEGSANRIVVMDRSGNTLHEATTEFGDVELSISIDAAFIAIEGNSQVQLLTRECNQLWSKKIFSVESLSVSNSGSVVVESYRLSLYDSGGSLLWGGDSGTGISGAVSISGDGKYIATVISDEIMFFGEGWKLIWSQKVAERLIPEDVAISTEGTNVAVAARSFYSPGQGAVYLLDNPPGTEVIKKPSIVSSRIELDTDPDYALIGREVKIWGVISHPVSSLEVIIRYLKPDGTSFTRMTLTKSDGSFSDTVVTDQIGRWRVNVSFVGSSDFKSANSSSSFLVEVVEEKMMPQSYQEGAKVSIDVGERRSLETVKSGGLYYRYRVIDAPKFVAYGAIYVDEIGGDDHIESTIKVMPWATPGIYKVKTEWGWSGSPIVLGEFKYTYQLDYDLEVKAPTTKYVTSLSLSGKGKENAFNATGTAYISINGYKSPLIGQSVNIEYSKPNGSIQTKAITTSDDGSFIDTVKTDVGGLWRIQALLKETESLEPSSSEISQFNAPSTSTTSQIPITSSSIIAGLSLSIALLVILKHSTFRKINRTRD